MVHGNRPCQDGTIYKRAVSSWSDTRIVGLSLFTKKQHKEESQQPRHLLSSYALHRGLCEAGLWSDTTRILRVMQHPMSSTDSNKDDKKHYYYSYQYEKIGHGWVQDVVKRHHVPDVDKDDLIRKLQERFYRNKDEPLLGWTGGGSSDLVSICQSINGYPTVLLPSQVAQALVELDPGAT